MALKVTWQLKFTKHIKYNKPNTREKPPRGEIYSSILTDK